MPDKVGVIYAAAMQYVAETKRPLLPQLTIQLSPVQSPNNKSTPATDPVGHQWMVTVWTTQIIAIQGTERQSPGAAFKTND